jgi:hypothetical protein
VRTLGWSPVWRGIELTMGVVGHLPQAQRSHVVQLAKAYAQGAAAHPKSSYLLINYDKALVAARGQEGRTPEAAAHLGLIDVAVPDRLTLERSDGVRVPGPQLRARARELYLLGQGKLDWLSSILRAEVPPETPARPAQPIF